MRSFALGIRTLAIRTLAAWRIALSLRSTARVDFRVSDVAGDRAAS